MTQPLKSKLSSMQTERRNYCLSQPDVIVFVIATFVTSQLTKKVCDICHNILKPETYSGLSKSVLERIRNFLAKFWNWNGSGTELNLILGRGIGTELVPILARRIGTDLDPKIMDR